MASCALLDIQPQAKQSATPPSTPQARTHAHTSTAVRMLILRSRCATDRFVIAAVSSAAPGHYSLLPRPLLRCTGHSSSHLCSRWIVRNDGRFHKTPYLGYV
ncbi:hypothetical protein HPB50_007271 [Hyalomma asiaticum]|uniref:Uncharacterized protein n=1 Tax=Hyalomma asiaticum TaxID=266040 RepID=A0ACB7RN22_HYAAI|nr:hypothetical protein HPB50_007271 [Hyalomma asiaticum]